MKDELRPTDMRAIDKNTEYNHIPTIVLMENAGSSIAHYIISNYPDSKKISIYSGSGGNGGDGFVVARHLLNYGYHVKLFLLCRPRDIKNEDSRINWQAIERVSLADSNLKLNLVTDSSQLKPDNSDIILDGILGTGVSGMIRQPIAKAIDVINNSPAKVLSIDVPSGLDPSNGSVSHKSVIAHKTLTLHKKKVGLSNTKYVGDVEVLDIGIPKVSEIYTGDGDLLKLTVPKANTHKGDNGSILIIGSNYDYIGAVIFAAESALTQGIDLVYIVVPCRATDIIKQYNPEYIVIPTDDDHLTLEAYGKIEPLISKVDSILIGSGAGLDEDTAELFNKIVESTDKPTVIDADGLKLVDITKIKGSNVVITPHAREFEAFFGVSLPEKFDDKLELLRSLSSQYSITILLKGSVDIITSHDDYKLNDCGNQGMTVGGTGDLLAGLVTAIATKNSVFEATYLAVYILTTAGDMALKEYGYNYTSSNILELL
ncbi:MAG: NAD(P)H-hydrate dehydratase [Methanosphaera sp.]|nr:NAD(P)H-hydrate dehydratase [Methanosphaera sp.]